MAEAIHSFSELATEVKKAIDQEDVAVLENIEDNVELTSTAVRAHALNTYLIHNKKRYKVIQPISIGDTLTVGTNIQLAPDLTAELEETKSEIDSLEENFTNQSFTNGAVNMLPNTATTQVIGEVTYTVNTDGTVEAVVASTVAADRVLKVFSNASGTGPLLGKRVRLSGCPSGGANNKYEIQAYRVGSVDGSTGTSHEYGNGIEFTWLNDGSGIVARIDIVIHTGLTAGTYIFKPMITLADMPNSDYAHYVPYAKGNQQLTQETTGLISNDFANGAVNLLPNNATTQVQSGVTFTVNDDGTIVANGTATGNGYCPIFATYNSNEYPLISGRQYKLSGCPSDGGNNSFRLYLEMNNTLIDGTYDIGNGAIFTAPVFNVKFVAYIRVFSGQTFNNKVFKPMITVADMPNSDYNHYVPYAKSNKELTDSFDALFGSGFSFSNQVSDINALLTNSPSQSFSINMCSSNNAQAPSAAAALIFTFVRTGNYGSQFAMNYDGAYYRANSNGTISAWQKLST